MDERRFRDTVAAFPTGVTIVTARGADGPAGLTTNAFTSLSLDPPLVLVCFDNDSRTLGVVRDTGRFAINVLRHDQEDLAAVRESRRFAVNVLRSSQQDLAALFAGKAPHPEKFAEVTHTEDHGVPVLDDALAWIVCDVRELLPGGDHTVGIGAVTALDSAAGDPLLFWRGGYRALQP